MVNQQLCRLPDNDAGAGVGFKLWKRCERRRAPCALLVYLRSSTCSSFASARVQLQTYSLVGVLTVICSAAGQEFYNILQ
jgi:hypothetical protein